MSHSSAEGGRTSPEPSLPQLISEMTGQVSTLVRDEMALAKAEIQQTVKDGALGAGLFGGAGVLALYGVAALIATAILGLATVLPAWLSALIVTLVLFAVAAVAALLGRRKVDAAAPVVERTPANVRADVETVKGNRS